MPAERRTASGDMIEVLAIGMPRTRLNATVASGTASR